MPHADREHELQISLATALRELDEARTDTANLRFVNDKARESLAAANARADDWYARWQQDEESLAAARRECGGLRKDIAALLPMAERAHRREPCFTLGAPDMGLVENLRVAREGALLLRLRHPESAALAAPASAPGEETER